MATANLLQTSVSGGTQNALSLQGDGVFFPKASTTSRLALTLTTTDKGFIVYDTTDNNIYFWNGAAWESVPSSGDAGANGSVQYNDNGIVSGASNFTYNKATGLVSLASATISGAATVGTTLGVTGVTTLTGNVGVGITPSAWATYKGLQVGYASLAGYAGADTFLGSNVYFDGGAFRYIAAGLASSYRQLSGSHQWSTAVAGVNPGDVVTLLTQATLDTSGNLLVGVASANANGGVLQLKSGITFPATQVAASDANTLDDYEEGSYTPTVTAEFGTIGTTTVNAATYTKIGRLVSIDFDISIITAGTGSGSLLVSIPFASGVEACGAGRESSNTGNMCQVFRGSATQVAFRFYNNLTPIANLNRFYCSYTYSV